MPKTALLLICSALAPLTAACDRSTRNAYDAAANSDMEVTHGEGASGGTGVGLSNESAELPVDVPPSSNGASNSAE